MQKFYFPEHLHDAANESGIAEIAHKIYDFEENSSGEQSYNVYSGSSYRRTEQITGEIQYFTTTKAFDGLSFNEKVTALHYGNIALSDEDKSWHILGSAESDNHDRLFPVDRTAASIACTPEDSLTLSGVGGIEYTGFQADIFEDYATYNFKSRLAFMQFAGAWLCNLSGFSDTRPSIDLSYVEDTGLTRRICIGGDMHGDFRAVENLIPTLGVLTPFGEKMDYGPIAPINGAAGYHSVEKAIVTALSAYVIDTDGLSSIEKQRLFEILLSERNEDTSAEKGASFYGDFGDDDFDDETVKLDLDSMRLNGQDNTPYFTAMVVPGNQDFRLIVEKTSDDTVVLRNTGSKKGIVFRPHEIPQLLELFGKIGQAESRTSTNSVLHALACAYQELMDGNEAGHIILSD